MKMLVHNSTLIVHILHNLDIDLYLYCVVHFYQCLNWFVSYSSQCYSSTSVAPVACADFEELLYICGQLSCFIGSAHTECLWVIGVLGFAHKFLAQT
jgi:hypothetical protein